MLLRAAVWIDMHLAAAAGILMLYALGKAQVALVWARFAVPVAALALLIVTAKGIFRLIMVPLNHLALTAVAICFSIEALLGGRVFIQLAYKDDIEGIGRDVLNLTDTLVQPFRSLEGSTPLNHTGVVEFATLTAMEVYLIGTIALVVTLMFWSEFLHMYRRVHHYFVQRSQRRNQERAEVPEAAVIDTAPALAPMAVPDMSTAAADLSAAS